jgi:hypothetical protein
MTKFRYRDREPKKVRIQRAYENGPYAHIQSREQLKKHLRQENSSYSQQMLSYVKQEEQNPEQSLDERHHILPFHDGGPDLPWNMVQVSFTEHTQAHQLRYDCFQQPGDELSVRFLLGTESADVHRARARLGHETMRREKIGFYNSDVARELGKRGGGKKTPKREESYTKRASSEFKRLLSKTLVFTHLEQNLEITFAPNTFERTSQIKASLLEKMDPNNPKTKLVEKDQNFATNFNKVFNRILYPGPSSVYRKFYKGWTVIVLD